MRTLTLIALALIALPTLAAEPAPTPTVTWEVWGFKWEGQWVKQSTHCLKTPNLKQAADYANSVNIVSGWCATTNVPNYVAPKPPVYIPRYTYQRDRGDGYDSNGHWTDTETYINRRGRRVAYPTEIDAATMQIIYGN